MLRWGTWRQFGIGADGLLGLSLASAMQVEEDGGEDGQHDEQNADGHVPAHRFPSQSVVTLNPS